MKLFKPIPTGELKQVKNDMTLRRKTEGFWILPTISRPQNLQRLIKSYNAMEEDAPVVAFIWRYDPKFSEVMDQIWPKSWIVLVESERFTAADAMRRAVQYAPRAAFYGFLADDVVFKTAWSRQLAESAVPCFISYPDDGFQHEALCTHFVVGGDLVRGLGWWALPGLHHTYLDSALMTLGHNVPGLLKYRSDVVWEHLHPELKKAKSDEIYEYARSKHGEDDATYKDWCDKGVTRDIKKAREILYGDEAA